MPTVLDYLNQHLDTSFSELALNDVDRACLNELGYLPFGELAGWTSEQSQTLASFVADHHTKFDLDFLITKERLQLCQLLASSKRFQGLIISRYHSNTTREFERQFAAVTFSLPSLNYHQIVFRGTDDSLIGWKEDFKLTYMREIPSHRSAISYLKQYLKELSGDICISGHSKGGNLALYASYQVDTTLQDQISRILWFDAPGLQQAAIKTAAYNRIKGKVQGYRPQESIVGIMLWHDENSCQLVESRSFGINQHNIFLWQVDDNKGQFIQALEASDLSLSLEKTFKSWTQELGSQELKQVFDLLFDSFLDNGVATFDDLELKNNPKLRNSLNALNKLEPRQKQLLAKSAKLLFSTFTDNMLSQTKSKLSRYQLKKLKQDD